MIKKILKTLFLFIVVSPLRIKFNHVFALTNAIQVVLLFFITTIKFNSDLFVNANTWLNLITEFKI